MKQVFNSREVAHVWAKQDQNEGCNYLSKGLKELSFISEHENNLNAWKSNIKYLFAELGNKRIRDIQGRINGINQNIAALTVYTNYFKLKVSDKELLSFARQAKEKQDKASKLMLDKAVKAYEVYIELWRKYDDDAITNLDAKTKDLCRYYAYTRLRYNEAQNRVETSKGVRIPVEVAKRAFVTLNGCFMTNCKNLDIPVMNYNITESTKDSIIAGCNTIPNEDVKYISNLLNW